MSVAQVVCSHPDQSTAMQVWPQAQNAIVVPAITPTAKVCSLVMGITVTLILFCSHFHQAVDDKAAGKLSPIVKIGTANGVKVTQLHFLT